MTTTLVVDNNKALAKLPEHLRGEVGNRDGKEGVKQGDLLIPRLKLAQAKTQERSRSHENYNPDLEEGQFFNSVTGEIYGEEVNVIPLHFFNEYIEFNADRKVVKYYKRGELPPQEDLELVLNSEGKMRPRCTTFKCRMSLILKEDGSIEPIVVSFKYVGTKTPTNKWNFLIAEKNLPAYAFVYNLKGATAKSGNDEWATGKFTRGDFTPAALYESAKQYFAALQEAGVKVDVSGIEQEEDTSFDQ